MRSLFIATLTVIYMVGGGGTYMLSLYVFLDLGMKPLIAELVSYLPAAAYFCLTMKNFIKFTRRWWPDD